MNRSRQSRPQPLYTGYSIKGAVESLTAAGWPVDEALAVIHSTVSRNFKQFAASWHGYCNAEGWMRDLLEQDEAAMAPVIERYGISAMVAAGRLVRSGGVPARPDFPQLLQLGEKYSELKQKLRSDGDHPAMDMMNRLYGLHPELAKAVALYSETNPWWVYVIMNILILSTMALFWLAVADPGNEVFNNESVHGVNWMHYVLVPGFGLAMLAFEVWMIREAPRRRKAWMDQFEKYRDAWHSQPDTN